MAIAINTEQFEAHIIKADKGFLVCLTPGEIERILAICKTEMEASEMVTKWNDWLRSFNNHFKED